MSFLPSGIQKLTAAFSGLIPESRAGENEARAKSLTRTWPELDMEVLKIVIFQLSNNFVRGLDGYSNIIHLVENFGLDNSNIIRALFRVASRELSIAAVLDNFFIAAYSTGSANLVSVLMQENKKTNHGMQVDVIDFPLYDALCESIEQRNLTLGKAILLSGNTSVTRVLQEDGIKLLRACAKSQDHRFAESMALLLISKGVDLKQDTVSQNSDYSRRELPSLQGALSAGNKSLTHNLLECGVDWSKIAPSSVMSFFGLGWKWTLRDQN